MATAADVRKCALALDGVSEVDHWGRPAFRTSKRIFAVIRPDGLFLHLPFPVLSDEKLALTRALDLPTMEVAGLTLIKRLALVIDDARITHVFYPVFPPDRNAGDVLEWLRENPVS